MKLYFRNDTPIRIWIAVMHYSPETCREYGNWATIGWFEFAPGEQAWVIETNNNWVAFYAESEAGHVWSGEAGPMYVYQDAFDSCINIGSTAADVVGVEPIWMGGSDTVQPLIL